MLYARFITTQVIDALRDSPVVFITGARQTGKTTLVQRIAGDKHPAVYRSLDDLTIRSAAQTDPHGFLKNLRGPAVLDEIQLVPELLPAMKLEVDEKRQPGHFLITGSANVLTLPRVSESLAGRMAIFNLHPLSQGELEGRKEGFIDALFGQHLSLPSMYTEDRSTLWQRVINGGFPEIQKRANASRKEAWFKDYVTTILQRDIRELANINGLMQMPRLLELLATRLASLLNSADISRIMQIPQTSMKRYLALFEVIYLIQRLLPWSGNLGKRLVKTPKVFFTDSGLAAYLVGFEVSHLEEQNIRVGPLLENFILSELRKQACWSRIKPAFFHFRSQTGQEVDIVMEDRRGRCVGIEVKAAATVRSEDFKGLRWFEKQLGESFVRGIVLYTGKESVPFGEKLFALPVNALWHMS